MPPRIRACSPEQGLDAIHARWAAIPDDDKPDALARAIAEGNHWPLKLRAWLVAVLEEFERRDVRGFDGEQARSVFDELPEIVTIYRGTVAAELFGAPGVHWTLRRDLAFHFAINGHQWPQCPHPRRQINGEAAAWHQYSTRCRNGIVIERLQIAGESMRPTLLWCDVHRDGIRIVAMNRGEQEVLVHPRLVATMGHSFITQPVTPQMREQLGKGVLP